MSKEITIRFGYSDYPSISNRDLAGAIAMMEEAIEDAIPGASVEVVKKGYDFGSGVINVVCPVDTDAEDLLDELKNARESGYDWKVGDSYEFEII